MCKIHKV